MLFSNQSYPSLAMDEIMDIFGTSDDCVFNPIDQDLRKDTIYSA